MIESSPLSVLSEILWRLMADIDACGYLNQAQSRRFSANLLHIILLQSQKFLSRKYSISTSGFRLIITQSTVLEDINIEYSHILKNSMT